jgi:hypothetical protein
MEWKTLIAHIEQDISGKAVQTLMQICEKLYKQHSKEEKTGHWKYSRVLLEWLLTMVDKVGEKNIFLFAVFWG